MGVAVVTVARGRRRHLERQAAAVARLTPRADHYVVVSLDEHPPALNADVVHRPVADGEPLPVGAARNAGIERAASADLVVLLDVDCLPEPDLLARLADADARVGGSALLAPAVGRLEPMADAEDAPDTGRLDRSRARAGSRPVPPPGELRDEPRHELFWSLAFALRPATHARIGGFDPGYVGYGAEDTDYAYRARAADVPLVWVGGAWAHHQHHPVSDPPVEHLADIVRNANRFHARWGEWPMPTWLRRFAEDGLVTWDPRGRHLELSPAHAA